MIPSKKIWRTVLWYFVAAIALQLVIYVLQHYFNVPAFVTGIVFMAAISVVSLVVAVFAYARVARRVATEKAALDKKYEDKMTDTVLASQPGHNNSATTP